MQGPLQLTPAGHPIDRTAVVVLRLLGEDGDQQAVQGRSRWQVAARGEEGEVLILGAGLSSGYHRSAQHAPLDEMLPELLTCTCMMLVPHHGGTGPGPSCPGNFAIGRVCFGLEIGSEMRWNSLGSIRYLGMSSFELDYPAVGGEELCERDAEDGSWVANSRKLPRRDLLP